MAPVFISMPAPNVSSLALCRGFQLLQTVFNLSDLEMPFEPELALLRKKLGGQRCRVVHLFEKCTHLHLNAHKRCTGETRNARLLLERTGPQRDVFAEILYVLGNSIVQV